MHALEAALAAEAAGLQGHFLEMHDFLYKYQSGSNEASNVRPLFDAYTGGLHLDVERFRKDSNSAEVRARVFSDGQVGVSHGVKNTPTVSINGRELRGIFTSGALHAAIEQRSLKTKTISWRVFGRGLLMPRIQLHAAAVPAAGFRAVALFLPSAWRISGSSPHNPWAVPSEKVTELLLNSACKEDPAR